jgi:hypothetical protein
MEKYAAGYRRVQGEHNGEALIPPEEKTRASEPDTCNNIPTGRQEYKRI